MTTPIAALLALIGFGISAVGFKFNSLLVILVGGMVIGCPLGWCLVQLSKGD